MLYGLIQCSFKPGCVARSVVHLTQEPEVPDLFPVRPQSFIFPSADSRKYVHEVLVNGLGGQSLPRKSVVRLTDCPDMTIDVYHGHKTTTHNNVPSIYFISTNQCLVLHYTVVVKYSITNST